jgi:4-alpha-glucanotransferase
VVYTGTHDNDTTLAWPGFPRLTAARDGVPGTPQAHALPLIRCAASVARLAVIPPQDARLGSEARMNRPSTTSEDIGLAFLVEQLSADSPPRLHHLGFTGAARLN